MDLTGSIASGESLRLEFKRGTISDADIYQAVVCLANGAGGDLLIGVEDDGTVTGARPRHDGRTVPDRLAAAIQNNTEPAHPVRIELVPVGDVEVIAVQVPTADPGPVGTKKGLFVKRVLGADGKPACVAMTPHEMVSRALMTRGIDYAATPAIDATHADMDPMEFDRFRRMCAATGSEGELARLSDADLAVALGLVPRDHPVSLGMVLLFGRPEALERWVPTAELLFQDLREGPTAVNDNLRMPLLKLAEEVQQRLDVRNATTEVLIGVQRIDVPSLPYLVRRESIANALVHRDYSQLGPITVQLTDSSFAVSNPGGFPPGVSVDNILEQSRPRSLILSNAFKRAGLVERKGKGVNEMFESQLRAGRDAPDYSRTTNDAVVVNVPVSSSDLDLVRFLAAYQDNQQRSLSLAELRVVHEVKVSGPATTPELAEYLGLTNSTARAVANTLAEAGILEARGSGRVRRFHLTARFYDLAQDRAAYVRVRSMDPLQQKQMVLDYVQTYGRITRRQVAELCQLSSPEARRLLKSLTDEGRLHLRGERRGAHYVMADPAT